MSKNTLVEAMKKREAKEQENNEAKSTGKTGKSYIPPSRRDKEQIYGWYSKEVYEALGILAVKERKSKQSLLGEALNMLFESRGIPPIA